MNTNRKVFVNKISGLKLVVFFELFIIIRSTYLTLSDKKTVSKGIHLTTKTAKKIIFIKHCYLVINLCIIHLLLTKNTGS
jgi:hypothetical protein